MNAPTIDVKDMLTADSSLALTFNTDLFVGRIPANPSDCVILFDTTSIPPQLTLSGDQGYEFPSIQVRVRSKSYQVGWNLINDIKEHLHGKTNTVIGSTLYTVIYCASGPALLDWDENSRARFICNFNLHRRLNGA